MNTRTTRFIRLGPALLAGGLLLGSTPIVFRLCIAQASFRTVLPDLAGGVVRPATVQHPTVLEIAGRGHPPIPPSAGTTSTLLLEGARTVVPAAFNPTIGEIRSAVTAVKFHTNQRDNTGTPGAIYIPSYQPGGLVELPEGVEKELNGVRWKEYSGEFSGYFYISLAGRVPYGPIDENGVDQSGNPGHEREGLKRGITFVLRIPPHWNGAILTFAHGGSASGAAHLHSPMDPFYALKKGYAYFAMVASGFARKDSNHNNDEFWSGEDRVAFRDGWAGVSAMLNRDTAAVIKNLCKQVTNRPAKRMYLLVHSYSGNTTAALSFGYYAFPWSDSPVPKVYDGGNCVTPYANVPFLPDAHNTPNPAYQGLDEPQVFDGFLNFSPGTSFQDIRYMCGVRDDVDPRIPRCSAPEINFDGTNEDPDLQLAGLSRIFFAHKAKFDTTYGNLSPYWPDITRSMFTYHCENLIHMPHAMTFASGLNGGGWYVEFVDAGGGAPLLLVNHNGRGLELSWETSESAKRGLLSPSWWTTDIGQVIFYNRGQPSSAGLFQALLDNLHEYVEQGTAMPGNRIDGYWLAGNTLFPKLPVGEPSLPPECDYQFWHWGCDIRDYYGGVYFDALNYLKDNQPIDYVGQTILLPEDEARLGTFHTGITFVQGISHSFTETELATGYRRADGSLIEYAYVNGAARTFEGYGNHGGYVRTLAHAVNRLTRERFFDPFHGASLVQKANASW